MQDVFLLLSLLAAVVLLAVFVSILKPAPHYRQADQPSEQPENRPDRQVNGNPRTTGGNLPALPFITDWRELPPEDRATLRTLSTAEIVQRYAIPARTARHWRELARSNGTHQKGEI
jgi:hypothetical protein